MARANHSRDSVSVGFRDSSKKTLKKNLLVNMQECPFITDSRKVRTTDWSSCFYQLHLPVNMHEWKDHCRRIKDYQSCRRRGQTMTGWSKETDETSIIRRWQGMVQHQNGGIKEKTIWQWYEGMDGTVMVLHWSRCINQRNGLGVNGGAMLENRVSNWWCGWKMIAATMLLEDADQWVYWRWKMVKRMIEGWLW